MGQAVVHMEIRIILLPRNKPYESLLYNIDRQEHSESTHLHKGK